MAGIVHETFSTGPERPILIALFGTMIGLPAFLRADEKKIDEKEEARQESPYHTMPEKDKSPVPDNHKPTARAEAPEGEEPVEHDPQDLAEFIKRIRELFPPDSTEGTVP